MSVPITVIIPVKNEEKNLENCLPQLTKYSEIIVVDSASTDRTVEISKQYGAKIVNFIWNGEYPKKRNWTLQNVDIKNEWVLFLDADEIVTNEFTNTVANSIHQSDCAGFWITYRNYFNGKELKYGDPQRKLALFKKSSGLYEQVEVAVTGSTFDMEIHEHPVLQGKVGNLRPKIIHNDKNGILKLIQRHVEYAKWEAFRHVANKTTPSGNTKLFTSRQLFKYRYLDRWWFPYFYFLYAYIYKLGFLDCSNGWKHAFYKLWYFQTIKILIDESRVNDENK